MLDIEHLKGLEYYDFMHNLFLDIQDKSIFIIKYTRKDCYKILKRFNKDYIKNQIPEYAKHNAFNAMTKERAYKHIKFYFDLHGYYK